MNNELNRRAPAQPEPAAPRNMLTEARDAIRGLLSNIRRDAPQLSGKTMGWAEQVANDIDAALAAAPTDAELDQMADTAWDRFQRHTAELQALENCRLYAARHRKEDWAATILRFCADGGATGSPLREAAPTVVEPLGWTVADAADRLKNGNVVEVSLEKEQPDDVPLYFAATPPRAALGERTTQVLNDLQSALGMMLTFFGMDEDENSESVFDTARQAYQYAQIVLRPIEPHEREALAKLRSTLHQWHESAVAKGFDGVASMLDSVAAAPTVVEPDDMAQQLEDALDSAQFYRRRCESLQSWQSKMRDPERTIVCDILANGRTLDPTVAGNRYATPPRAALTDWQIGELARPGYNGFAQQVLYDFIRFARAIEAAHGITADRGQG